MRRPSLSILFVLGLGAAALYGADFWEAKKYSEWSGKEVEKMLTNSPWARRVDISIGGARMRVPGAGSRSTGGFGSVGAEGDIAGPGGTGGAGGAGGGGGRRGGAGGGVPIQDAPTVRVHLRWVSALPVKQALVRLRYGDEVETSAEAAQMLQRQDDRYILAVSGLPARAVRGDFEELKSDAFLKIKGQEPISPVEVQGRRQQGQADIYLFFPKGQDGGYDVTVEDKNVEVDIKLPNARIRRTFKLKDMVYSGKLEI